MTLNRREFIGTALSLVMGPSVLKALVSRKTPSLEEQVDAQVKVLRNQDIVPRDVRTSWYVYDLSNNKELVSINADVPRQAASVIKMYIALAYFHKYKKEYLTYNGRSKNKDHECFTCYDEKFNLNTEEDRLKAMLDFSDNGSTNFLIDEVGGLEKVRQILQQNYSHVLKHTEIVEYIPPKSGKTYENKSSASDYARFLKALWQNKLPESQFMKKFLSYDDTANVHGSYTKIPIISNI